MTSTTATQSTSTPTTVKNGVIGTITITEIGDPVTENHTSYAADHRTYRVQPGTYDVKVSGHAGTPMVVCTVDVIQTAEALYSGICGNNFGVTEQAQAEKVSTKTYQIYAYDAAKRLTEGSELLGGKFRFADGVTIQVRHHELKDWDSEARAYHPTNTTTHVVREFVS